MHKCLVTIILRGEQKHCQTVYGASTASPLAQWISGYNINKC